MAPRTWPALTVRFTPHPVAPAPEDALAAARDGLGATAVEESGDAWRVFFHSAPDRDRALAALAGDLAGSIDVASVDVPDEDWARRSQQGLRSVVVGRVTIAPPWDAEPTASEASADGPVTIVIQPSMGFGTGHHASTRLCTALLQRVEVAGRRVIDVGTGSGVLALVARALGASSVLAIDDDPDAIESARENLALNGGPAGIELRVADFRGLSGGRADVVTANLTGALLARGAHTLAEAVAPGGCLIVSGVTLEEERAVVNAFAPGLRVVDRLGEDEWIGLVLADGPRP